MIMVHEAQVPFSMRGIGDVSTMTGDAVAVAQRADRVFRQATELSTFPFLGSVRRQLAQQIANAADQAHQDVQLNAMPVAEISARVSILEAQYADAAKKARTYTILASVGLAAVLVGGSYTILHWTKKKKKAR